MYNVCIYTNLNSDSILWGISMPMNNILIAFCVLHDSYAARVVLRGTKVRNNSVTPYSMYITFI